MAFDDVLANWPESPDDEPWHDTLHLLILRDGARCRYCRAPLDPRASADDPAAMQIDHIHPLSRADDYDGPINGLDNLAIACRPCNAAKGAKMLGAEWTPPAERTAPPAP